MSLERGRRAVSNGIAFESGTGGGSNISKEYFLKQFFLCLSILFDRARRALSGTQYFILGIYDRTNRSVKNSNLSPTSPTYKEYLSNMNLFNFGREHLNNGSLNNMLEQVGIDDVGSFVNQFRNQASASAGGESDDIASGGSSFSNQFTGGRGGNNSGDMIQGAMNAYKMFSGGQGGSSGGGGGGFLNNIGSTYQNAQQMYALYKKFDKNGDGKITVEDIQIYLQEIGLGSVSPYLAKALFQAVDQNHNGTLDFTDLMALTTMINKLSGQFGGGAVRE